MSYLVVWTVAFLASGLTFFSGFGLGTLLLPAFALFFAIELAVALTAVVHFLNGAYKLILVWRHINWPVLVRFGVPAIGGALLGSWLLVSITDGGALLRYSILGREVEITAVKLTVGVLLLLFACAELSRSFRKLAFPPEYQPLGGLLSGFFGGLAGMQGALRSAFLVKAGLTKEAYIATGSAIAFLIDVSRLGMYVRLFAAHRHEFDYVLLIGAVMAALGGATVGNRYLSKATMGGVQTIVAILLFGVAAGLILGLL
jgi:uncharacterized membrane protein YfcA